MEIGSPQATAGIFVVSTEIALIQINGRQRWIYFGSTFENG